MYRILKGRFHIANRCKAIGSAVSTYATVAFRRLRLRFMRRESMAKDLSGRTKRTAASTRARGRQKARYTQSAISSIAFTSTNRKNSAARNKSPYKSGKKRRHDARARHYTVDRDGDVAMGGDTISRTENPLIFYTPATSFSKVPSTPKLSFARTPSTPQTSGSSFAQSFADTPCPANNAFHPIPDYSDAMEGVVCTSSQQARSNKPAPSRAPAPAKNGVMSFTMHPATTQAPAVVQPNPKPTPAQPPQPKGTAARPAAPAAQPPAVPVPKKAAASAPVWVTNDPAQVFKAPSWPKKIASLWEKIQTLPNLPTGTQPWDATAWAATWAANDPAQVFKTPSWSVAIAPRWTWVESLPHLPPRAQIWNAAAASYFVWVINDPAKALKIPSWPMTIAPRWASVESLPRLLPGAQLWNAAASYYLWAINDPAKAFKIPSWPMTIAPRWATVHALPQLPRGTQVWELKDPSILAVPQPSTSKEPKPTPTIQPVTPNPTINNQPTCPSVSPSTDIVEQGPSFEDSMQALVDQLTTCHVSHPDTWAWSEPSIFGPYLKDKNKSKGFQEKLATMVITMLPGSDSNHESSKAEPQQIGQQEAIPPSLSAPPATQANDSSSAVPDAMVLEQPSEVLAPPETSAGLQPVEQAHVPFPDTSQTATSTALPTNEGSSDEAMEMETEGSQPADQDVAVQGEPGLTTSTFQFDNVPQLFAEVNNPFVNAPTFPTFPKAPATVPQLGSHGPLSLSLMTNGTASQEKPYEVGSDDDPNVDLEFDFSKHFKRAGRAPKAATTSTPPASISPAGAPAEESPVREISLTDAPPPCEVSTPEAFPAPEASPPSKASPIPEQSSTDEASTTAETPPSSVSPPVAEISLPAETFPPTEEYLLSEAFPALTSPADLTAQDSTSAPAASITFGAPPLPSGGFDFSASRTPSHPRGSPSKPRGERKRLRDDREADSMHDEEDTHSDKFHAYGWLPPAIYDAKVQHERKKALVADLKADPAFLYDADYALTMMNDMFYDILPSIVSELLFPPPLWTEANREEMAKIFVDAMLEDELNERSFEIVQEAYEPKLGMQFPVWRDKLYKVFIKQWWEHFMLDELPQINHKITKQQIFDLGEPVEEAFWDYMDDNPPEDGA